MFASVFWDVWYERLILKWFNINRIVWYKLLKNVNEHWSLIKSSWNVQDQAKPIPNITFEWS